MAAWIEGVGVDDEAAFAAAADLLAGARLPAIGGLVADVDGIRASLGLAAAIGGIVDPSAARHLYAGLGSFAAAGTIATTPTEAVCRADLVVVVGEAAAQSRLLHRLAGSSPMVGRTAGMRRKIVALGSSPPGMTHLGCPTHPAGLPATIALFRAVAAGRLAAGPEVTALAGDLAHAKFGVVIYDPGELGELAVQALVQLLQEVNETARCFALPLADSWQGQSIVQVAAWTTGLPPRVGFGRGAAEHDPWRFDLERAAAAGEVDAVLWLAALPAPPPPFGPDLPVVALLGKAGGEEARVVIEVGVPGETCGGALWDEERGAIGYREAARAEQIPGPAAVLDRLQREVIRLRQAPC